MSGFARHRFFFQRAGLVTLVLTFGIPFSMNCGAATETPEKPSLEIILENYVRAAGGRAAIEKVNTRVCTGRYAENLNWKTPRESTHPVEASWAWPDRWCLVEQEPEGITSEGSDGRVGWRKLKEMVESDDGKIRSRLAFCLDPRAPLRVEDYFRDLNYRGCEEWYGQTVHVVDSVDAGGRERPLRFNVETGLLVGIGHHWELKDYREIDGVMVPCHILMGRKGGWSAYIFDETRFNVPVNENHFAMPEPGR